MRIAAPATAALPTRLSSAWWTAYRVSAIVGPGLEGLVEVSDVVRALDLSEDAISPDAEHAIRALPAKAGFRGPDRLYR